MSDLLKKITRFSKSDISFSLLESCGTRVIASVSSLIKEKNKAITFECKHFLPLGGLVYDSQSDCYLVECFDYLCLGSLPISFVASMKGCPNWTTNFPLPEKVIKSYLSPKKKKELKNFFSSFDSSFVKFYIQMLDPNCESL